MGRVMEPSFLEDVRDKGEHMIGMLRSWVPSNTMTVKELRTAPTPSLWAGLELTGPAGPVQQAALDRGVFFITAGPNTIRLSPPLTVSKDEISHAMTVLRECVTSTAGRPL